MIGGGVELKDKDGKPFSKEAMANMRKLVIELYLYNYCGNRYQKKKETIARWMEADRVRDEKLENAVMPRGFSCLVCGSGMLFELKTLDIGLEDEQVLFFFRCENKDCKKGRVFYEGGKEWRPKPNLCPQCRNPLTHTDSRKDDVITTTYTCGHCGHTHSDTLDLKGERKPELDKDFEKDRERFCFDEKKGKEFAQSADNLERFAALAKQIEDRNKDKAVYEEVAKLNKLPVAEVQKTLAEALEKEHYVNLQFQQPEMSRDVIVGFTVMDGKSNRDEYESVKTITKLIDKILVESNWKLMHDGISYRMGYLSGRLRGLESENDLVELAKQRDKKSQKKSKGVAP